MHLFTKELYFRIKRQDAPIKLLKYIYDILGSKIKQHEYLEVDQIIAEVIITDMPDSLLFGFLVATLPGAEFLNTRFALFKDIEEIFIRRHGKDKAEVCLQRLH